MPSLLQDQQYRISNGSPEPNTLPLQTWTSLVSLSPIPHPEIPIVNLTKVGGPDRPPSKRMLEQMRANEQAQRAAGRSNSSSSSSPAPGRQDEGYWAYMQRQVQERTQNLNIMGDSMEHLEDNSAKFGDDVSKFVGNTKKKVLMGGKSFHQWFRLQFLF